MNTYMGIAIEEAEKGLGAKDGGPFGAVVVKDGKIIARGHNKVVSSFDPTAHAEILAIREASKLLERFDLSDCELYTTCEPCPMCFSAIHWARIGKIYYGATRQDAANIGFDDAFLYDILNGTIPDETLKKVPLEREACLASFKKFEMDEEKIMY